MTQPKAVKHPTDEGKWMSSFDDYGHGPGQGKSRNAIYKRFNKINKTELSQNSTKMTKEKQARSTPIEISQNREKVEVEESDEEISQNRPSWGRIEWDEDELSQNEEIKPRTIPKPISEMAQGRNAAFDRASQAQMVRLGFRSLDRLLTHYGRGVMNKKDWAIDRSEDDYDALEGSTMAVLDHYGVHVPVSPLMVWGATMGTAYAPPLNHIRKNADPNRRKGRILKGLSRLIPKRFRRKKEVVNLGVVEPIIESPV